MERQLDEIACVINGFNFNQINFHNIGLNITNDYYLQDVKDLHQLIVQHMQYTYYSTTHKIIKQKDTCKFNCFLIVEGQVDVYDCKEDGEPLYSFKHGDIFTDKEIMKAQKKSMVFVFHPHTHAGQTKYEDIQDTLEFSNATQEEKNNKFLQLIYLFQKLNLQHFKDILSHLTFKEYLNGETVFQQKDKIDSFFIVKSGEFIIKKDFTPEYFTKQDSFEQHNDHKDIDSLFLSKKSPKKTLQLRVMIQHEVFGEEELIKSYFQAIQSSPNQQIPKDFTTNLFRSYSVQCSSTQGTLIKISKEDLFKKIIGKMKYDQIQDLVYRIDSKVKNSENKVRKIRKSIIPFKQYLISETNLDSSNDLLKQTPKYSRFNRPNSVSYSQTPKILASSNNNLSIGSTSKRNLGDISGCANQSIIKRSLTPNSQPNRNNNNFSQILTIKVTNDSFSDKLSLIQRAVSQIESVKTASTLFSSNTPIQSPLNTPRNRPFSAKALDKENHSQDNSPSLSVIRHASSRPASSSIFCSMKKLSSNNQNISKQIQSFSNLEPQNLSISQNINAHFFKDQINDHVKEATSKVFLDDKSIITKKRFSVYEKSTMETSFNQHSETMLKSPRLKIQLGIQNNTSSNKSQDLTNQEKKLKKFEDKIKRKIELNNPIQKAQFIEFVPQPNPNKQDKVISEKIGACPTYQGLNTKVVDTVKQRKVKIQLIQPIFDRGYAENFNKEIIKLNKRNTKHNYIVDVKEDNKAKGLSKFSLLQQVMEKQNKLQKMQQLHYENQNTNRSSFNPNSSNILSITSQQNLTSHTNLNYLSVNKEGYQNNSLQASENTLVSPLQVHQRPRMLINTNINLNSSQIISSPLQSPKGFTQSLQVSPLSSPVQNKSLKNTFNILQKLVEDKQISYKSQGFVGQNKNSRSQSYSIKSPQYSSQTPNYLHTNFSNQNLQLNSPSTNSRPIMKIITKSTKLISPTSQPYPI